LFLVAARASLSAPVPAPVQAPVQAPIAPSPAPPLQGLTILVVDDAPTIVRMVTRMLTSAGATVESAKDGREGVEVFRDAEVAFDIVVTDIQVHTQRIQSYRRTCACTHTSTLVPPTPSRITTPS
jgi:hypothetical protein